MPVGVVFTLSTRLFLDPDLGVMLLLRKAETGVESSSFDAGVAGVPPSPPPPPPVPTRGCLRDKGNGVICGFGFGDGAEPATRGVIGGRWDALAEALREGARGREALCL